MRAIMVEFTGADDRDTVEGRHATRAPTKNPWPAAQDSSRHGRAAGHGRLGRG